MKIPRCWKYSGRCKGGKSKITKSKFQITKRQHSKNRKNENKNFDTALHPLFKGNRDNQRPNPGYRCGSRHPARSAMDTGKGHPFQNQCLQHPYQGAERRHQRPHRGDVGNRQGDARKPAKSLGADKGLQAGGGNTGHPGKDNRCLYQKAAEAGAG